MVATAEQGYHHFLDVLSTVTAEIRLLIGDLGQVHAFAYLTARLRLEALDVRAALAAVAVVRLAQLGDGADTPRPGEPPPPP